MDKTSRREDFKERFPEAKEAIDAACEKHGEDEIVVHDTRGGIAIFRTPLGSEYTRFTSQILSDKGDVKANAPNALARSCVVHPPKEEFAKWLEKYGAIGTAVLPSLVKLAGGELAERGKE